MVVAVFDVDKTLLRGDSLLIAAKNSNNFIEYIYRTLKCLPDFILWKLNFLTTKELKERYLVKLKLCEHVNTKEKEGKINWLLPILKKNLRKEALFRLIKHQRAGDEIFLCSASPRMILEPLAEYLDVKLLCTELLKKDGNWFPEINGSNCKGIEKVKRIEAELISLNEIKLEVYGDSKGDKELLNKAHVPHYKNFSDTPSKYPTFSLSKLLPIFGIFMLIYIYIINIDQAYNLLDIYIHSSHIILIGLILVFIGYVIRFTRWRFLLYKSGHNPNLIIDAQIWMGSFAFTATPGKSGEMIRCLLLKERCNLPFISTFSALIIERVTDATSVIAIIIINLPYILKWDFNNSILNKIRFILLIVLMSLILIKLTSRWLTNKIKLGLRAILKRTKYNIEDLTKLKDLIKPSLIAKCTLIGSLSWGLEGVCLYLIIKTFGFPISLGGAIFAHTTAGLIGALTFFPGGLGPTEVGTIGLLTLQGVPLPLATSATLLIRLMTIWFATFLGVFSLLIPYKKS